MLFINTRNFIKEFESNYCSFDLFLKSGSYGNEGKLLLFSFIGIRLDSANTEG